MPQTGQVASDSTVGAFTALDEGKQREVLGKLSPDAKQGLLAGIKSQQSLSQRTQSAATAGGASTGPAPFAPMKTINTNPLGEAMESSKTLAPVNKALAPVGKFLNSQRGREFQMATGVAGGGIEAPPEIPATVTAMTPESPRKQGIMDRLMHPSNIRKVARDVGEKYVGKTLGDVILPPPPEPPVSMEEVATQKAAQKVADRAAEEKVGLRRPAADVEAERATKLKNAAYAKDAQEQMAIEGRYQDELEAKTNERLAAEKQLKKAHQEFADSLDEIGKARQRGLSDMGKLNENYTKALKLQADAEREAQEANEAEDSAKATLQKVRTTAPKSGPSSASSASSTSSSSVRPTDSEQFLTGLAKKRILSLEDDAQGRRYFGNKWKLRQGEGPVGRVERLLGDERSGRNARGMADTGMGPGLPPPPTP